MATPQDAINQLAAQERDLRLALRRACTLLRVMRRKDILNPGRSKLSDLNGAIERLEEVAVLSLLPRDLYGAQAIRGFGRTMR